MKSTLSPQIIQIWKWLQEAATNVWCLLLGILLFYLALWLFLLVTIASIGFYFATIGKKKQNAGQILRSQGSTYKLIAIGVDILGNIIGGPFLNWLLLKKPSQFPYGVPGQTISSITQINYKLGNLSEWGLNLKHDLDTIEEDHCERSLELNLNYYCNFLEKYKRIQAHFETIERTKEFMARYN